MVSSFLQQWWPPIVFVALLLIMTKGFTRPPCSFISGLCSTGSSDESDEALSASDLAAGIEHVTTTTFEDKVLRVKSPVLVDFYATWCGPCRALAPVLVDLAGELSDAKIVKVNVDQNPELAARYKVSSIPNLLVFKDGQPTAHHAGLADKATLRRLLLD